MRHSIATCFPHREQAVAGGLMSYGADITDPGRQLCRTHPQGREAAHLPVQQSTKFELVINFKTAKALGLTIPPTVLARADEVIE